MASPGRSWRGRRGGFRGGRRGGPPRGRPRDLSAEDLGSRKIELDTKAIIIEIKSNEQGRFMKIIEIATDDKDKSKSPKVIFSMESAQKFLPVFDSLNTELKHLGPLDESISGTSKINSTELNQGRRHFYIDLCENQRGRFIKLAQVSRGRKSFVNVPADVCDTFRDMCAELLEDHGTIVNGSPPASSQDNLPLPQEVRAGGKSFFFDVARNDRGVYVRLSEVLRNSGRRNYINIPNSCWQQISQVFSNLHQEMPYDVGSASGSGSEDNN